MCGIAGYVDFDGHSREEAGARVKRMTDALVYRGPDAEGFFVDAHAALGHRRLSIIDLGSGQQPMAAAGGAVQIVFNGEIYNFQALRDELEAAGHCFATRSDTEVILQAYLAWGEACVERLNGMFAFAIWDTRHRRLFLARDRVGKKPLYWYRSGSRFGFASELKALRVGGLCADEVDPEALDCYFTFGYVPAPRTIYRGVRKLQAARTLTVEGAGERERRYWTLRCGTPREISLDEAVDELEPLLDDAVRCRLMSEVPLGAFLSGGLDSSLVAAAMSRMSGGPVSTHSIGFDEREFSELETARATASFLGTNHHEYTVRPVAAEVLPRIARHFDEPLADSSAIPTWYVCEMARRSVTVALSGDGGDEAFAGYTFRYLPHSMESRLRARMPVALRSVLFGPLGRLWPASARLPRPLRLKTILENLAVGDVEAFYRDLAWLRDDARRAVYAPGFMESLRGFTPRETVYPWYLHNDAPDALARAQYADMHFYMTDDVLAKVDRMSMAHSLEVRSPLLDYRILEFAARLPSALKMDRHRGKLPLRALARRRLPAGLLDLPKRGFSIPAAKWLREELRPMAEVLLFDGRSASLAALDRARLQAMWREHVAGSRDHSVFVWAVMMLALWEDAAAGQRATER
ncbi:MAG: asparagine synthase (glutamine-hydrolyzing) [Burkholderiaceae bacterium]|nr:asparagine synthase (glutamine-hydrolyzing) [Burkholderiaceae bacterium]